MNTYYIVDNGNNFNIKHLEYMESTDTIHLILRNVPRKGDLSKVLKNPFLKNNIEYSLVKGYSENTVDFTLVPMIFEIIMKNKDKKVVIISKNTKLSCLANYYKARFNYVLEIADSVKDYYVINYIAKEVEVDYDKASSIFKDLIKIKSLGVKEIPKKIKAKLEKNEEFFNRILDIEDNFWENEGEDRKITIPISENASNFIKKKLEEEDLGLSEGALKRVVYFLKKSDNLHMFYERLNSGASNLGIDKNTKEVILNKVKRELVNYI